MHQLPTKVERLLDCTEQTNLDTDGNDATTGILFLAPQCIDRCRDHVANELGFIQKINSVMTETGVGDSPNSSRSEYSPIAPPSRPPPPIETPYWPTRPISMAMMGPENTKQRWVNLDPL
jgi:hypothetical protein